MLWDFRTKNSVLGLCVSLSAATSALPALSNDRETGFTIGASVAPSPLQRAGFAFLGAGLTQGLSADTVAQDPFSQPLHQSPAGSDSFQLRAGYDFGAAVGYLSLGRLEQTTQGQGKDRELIGLGLTVILSDQILLNGEVLHQQNAADSPLSGDNRLSLSAAFRF